MNLKENFTFIGCSVKFKKKRLNSKSPIFNNNGKLVDDEKWFIILLLWNIK